MSSHAASSPSDSTAPAIVNRKAPVRRKNAEYRNPHMLRHATGYKLANDGRDTRAIQHRIGGGPVQKPLAGLIAQR